MKRRWIRGVLRRPARDAFKPAWVSLYLGTRRVGFPPNRARFDYRRHPQVGASGLLPGGRSWYFLRRGR